MGKSPEALHGAEAGPNPPEFACIGKERFESAKLAKLVSRRSRQKHHSKLAAYRCQYCRGWHIGEHIKGSSSKSGDRLYG